MLDTYLQVANGAPVRIDADLLEQLLKYQWRHVGGRVISVKSPNFAEVLDLATVIAGFGAVVLDAHDYRRVALNRVLVRRGANGRIEVHCQSGA